jgi:hypothetical protein
MGELFGDEITDYALEGEIELLADVITAVQTCQGRLTGRALDEALGLVADGSAGDDDHEGARAVKAFDAAHLHVAGG